MVETEKITINMNVVDLGKVDLLVSQGYYSNRTDLIRTAIRNAIKNECSGIGEFSCQASIYRWGYRFIPEKI